MNPDTIPDSVGTDRERRFTIVFLIGSLALASAGILYSIVWAGPGLRFPDEFDYLAIASHLLEGVGYSQNGIDPSADRPPGYPIALVAMLAVGESVHVVRALQFGMIAVTIVLLASLPRPHAAGRSALACSLLIATACFPVILYTAGTLFPQTLVALLLATVLALSLGPPQPLRHGIAGLFCGWTVLATPTALVIVPVALLIGWRRAGTRAVIAVLVGTTLLPALWTARNLVVLGEPIVLSRSLALNLDNAVLEAARPDEAVLAEREPDSTLGYGVERLMQLVREPDIYLGKLLGYFAYRNDLATDSEESSLRDLVMFATYYSLLGLVAWRLLQTRHHRLTEAEIAILLLYVGTALFHALVFTRIRYRIPFDCLLLLPAVNAVWIATLTRNSQTAQPPAMTPNAPVGRRVRASRDRSRDRHSRAEVE